MLVCEGKADKFAYQPAVSTCYGAAREAYGFLGATEKLGISYHGGGHKVDWPALLDFADWQLAGKTKPANRSFDLPPALPADAPRYFDWAAPRKEGRQP